MPNWIESGFKEYEKRLKPHWPLNLIEIPLLKRSKPGDAAVLMKKEGEKMCDAIPNGSFVISLEIQGQRVTTEALADKIQKWQSNHLCFLVGGPEGLSTDALARADARLSLSDLTLPHPLVRVILSEQLYRAWSITQNHPYHK